MEGITDIKITNRIAKERKFGKMMAIIISLFFISYGPTYLLKQVKLRISIFLFIFAISSYQKQGFTNIIFYIQIHRQATKTHTAKTILYLFIQSSVVVIDPIVYILCNAKYRKEIKRILYKVTGKTLAIFDTSGDKLQSSASVGTLGTPNLKQRLASYRISKIV